MLALPAGGAYALTAEQALRFVAQSVCVNEAGAILPITPLDPGCKIKRPQKSTDKASYRKHDQPNRGDTVHATGGYEASDSTVEERGGRTAVIQTFDFGDEPRRFGRFDRGNGDGGQVLLFVPGGWVSAAMTEDGGAGVQFFVGPGCKDDTGNDLRFHSWLFFRNDVGPEWQDEVARLTIARGATDCPRRFTTAYTRYRLADIPYPFRIPAAGGALTTVKRTIPTILSEHYAGDAIVGAEHLERFFFARDFGMMRWERWENLDRPRVPNIEQLASDFAATGRCAASPGSESPGPRWRLIDCRAFNTLLPPPSPGWSVRGFGWSAVDQLGPAE